MLCHYVLMHYVVSPMENLTGLILIIKILYHVVSGLLLRLYRDKLNKCFVIIWLDNFATRLTTSVTICMEYKVNQNPLIILLKQSVSSVLLVMFIDYEGFNLTPISTCVQKVIKSREHACCT